MKPLRRDENNGKRAQIMKLCNSIVPWCRICVTVIRGAVSYLNQLYRTLSTIVLAQLLLITRLSHKGRLSVCSPKSHNQLAGARAANRKRRVMAVGTPFSQLASVLSCSPYVVTIPHIIRAEKFSLARQEQ